MLTTLLAFSVAGAAATQTQPRISTASLFKNGYAMVVREIAIGDGRPLITDIPQSSLGTFWVSATEGTKILELVNAVQETKTRVNVGTMDELLLANVGKEIEVIYRQGADEREEISGKLLSATGQIIVVEGGNTIAIPKGNILSVLAGDLVYTREQTEARRVLRIRAEGPAGAKIFLIGLERGMTWSPAYALDISDPKTLTLTAKSTLINDLGDLGGVEVQFITGFPNVPWAAVQEPLLSGLSVDQFTNFMGSIGIPKEGFARRETRGVMGQAAAPEAFADAFEMSELPGVQAEDLFFYRQPNVTLKKGERGFYMLFTARSEYSHLYTLDLPDQVSGNVDYRPIPAPMPPDVWHSIKFKNTSNQPLTTAPATVYKDGRILGQDTIRYTSVGAEQLLRMTKAMDVQTEAFEEEVARQRQALQVPNQVPYDLVTLRGTIQVRNRKSEPIQMRIVKELTGEIVSSEGNPKIVGTAKGLREINPRQRLEWGPQVAAGQTLTLTYTYRLYVRE